MSTTIVITAGKTFGAGETVDNAKLNLLGLPTAAVTPGTVDEADLTTAVQAKLNSVGSMMVANVAKSASWSVLIGDKGTVFEVTTGSSADVTATLPSAATAGAGFTVWFRKADTGTKRLLFSPATSPDSMSLSKQNQLILLESDGTNWTVPLLMGLEFDVNGNLFTRSGFIALGGNDATIPALKVNGTTLQFRLGDDTGDAGITAKSAIFSGAVSNSGWFPLGSLTGSPVIDATKGNRQWGTITGALTNVSITGMTEGQPLVVSLLQDGTGHTVTWTGITWGAGGGAPTQTITAAKRDFYSFEKIGSTIFGNQLANF